MSVVTNVSADHGIGFVVGSTYGYGLGYNRYLDNGYGWQISGYPHQLPRLRPKVKRAKNEKMGKGLPNTVNNKSKCRCMAWRVDETIGTITISDTRA